MRAAQRREHELRLARQRQQPLTGRFGQRDRADEPVLGQRERGVLRVPLPVDEDHPGLEVDLLPGERVELAWTHPLVDGRVQERGERRRRQLVGQLDEAGDLGLPGRLGVAPATARPEAELGERVAVDEPACRGAGGVVEERP